MVLVSNDIRLTAPTKRRAACELAVAPMRTVWLVACALFVAGAFTVYNTSAQAVVQLAAPDHIRGRVVSIYFYASNGFVPVGGIVLGGVCTSGGTELTFGVLGVLGLASIGFFSWSCSGPMRRRCEHSPSFRESRSATRALTSIKSTSAQTTPFVPPIEPSGAYPTPRQPREWLERAVAVKDDNCAYGCAYRFVSFRRISLQFVATVVRGCCSTFQFGSVRCSSSNRTFNPGRRFDSCPAHHKQALQSLSKRGHCDDSAARRTHRRRAASAPRRVDVDAYLDELRAGGVLREGPPSSASSLVSTLHLGIAGAKQPARLHDGGASR